MCRTPNDVALIPARLPVAEIVRPRRMISSPGPALTVTASATAATIPAVTPGATFTVTDLVIVISP